MFSVFRSKENPFLSPDTTRSWESLAAFNPSVVLHEGVEHFFYRALSEPDAVRTPGRGFSTIGYTKSKDGTFSERVQVIVPTESWEEYGCEDPRATFFEGKWYVFYTALGGYPFGPDNIRTAVAIGDTPTTLNEKHLLAPFNAKAATLFPERIGNDVALLITAHTDWTPEYPRPTIGIARAKEVSEFWNESFWHEWHNALSSHAFPDVRRADSEHMEVGATPIRTKDGWLFIYSHIQNYYDEHNRIFGIEALLLDIHDPSNILAKTEFPFLVPEEFYEKYGLVSNIVFPSSAQVAGDTLTIYYGGADTVSAKASLSLSHLLSSMKTSSRNSFMERQKEPMMLPIPEHEWESHGVSNAATLDIDGVVHMMYRGVDRDNHSMLGYARISDGIHVDERIAEPIYKPRESFESHGTEDPRLMRVGDTIYLTYTAFDGTTARCALSTIDVQSFVSKDFSWTEPISLTPEHINDKDFCILDVTDDETIYIHRVDPNICVTRVAGKPGDSQITSFRELLGPRVGMWDGIKVGAAGPPIRVPEGWLFVYHAVGPDFHYRLGAMLLDESFTIILGRTDSPILEPLLSWEKEGLVPNVIFSCGMVLRDDSLYVYYGGADTVLSVATISLKKLMNRLQPEVY